MAHIPFKELFDQAESGVFVASIPTGTYSVVVTDARPRAESNLIFLTLQVLDGPAAQKQTEVNLYFPKEGDRPFATTMFLKKIAGFMAYPDVKAAGQSANNAPTTEAALQLIADALVGKTGKADVVLRGQDAGQYAGSNELSATQRPTGDSGAPQVPQTATTIDNGQVTTVAAPF